MFDQYLPLFLFCFENVFIGVWYKFLGKKDLFLQKRLLLIFVTVQKSYVLLRRHLLELKVLLILRS
jgi:hypothetical protein